MGLMGHDAANGQTKPGFSYVDRNEPDAEPPKKSAGNPRWLQVGPFLLALAGSLVAIGVASANADRAGKDVIETRAKLDAHLQGDVTPVLAEKMRTSEIDRVEVHKNLERIEAAIEKLSGNVIAVCMQTPGATCVR